jgi:hypothetical protein
LRLDRDRLILVGFEAGGPGFQRPLIVQP